MSKESPTLGVVGGSSFYFLEGLEKVKEIPVDTPFGPTPDPVVEGFLGSTRVLFVSRHGQGHRLLPEEVPYRATIFALKKLGADAVIGVSAVGSLKEEFRPGDLAVIRQFIDATCGRPSTFFGNGIAGHVTFADPACPTLADTVYGAARKMDINIHPVCSLKVMQGPQFSTRAESFINRQLDIDLIGMTSLPEAKLAREAELCFVTLAMVTDFDCWYEGEEDVTADMVTARLGRNVDKARGVIKNVAEAVPSLKWSCGCRTALDQAVVTNRDRIPERFRTGDMAPIFGRILGGAAAAGKGKQPA